MNNIKDLNNREVADQCKDQAHDLRILASPVKRASLGDSHVNDMLIEAAEFLEEAAERLISEGS